MNKQQRNDLHSVIAHGLTSLRGKKLILEGQLTRREKYNHVPMSEEEVQLRKSADQVVEAELMDINNKLEIGTNALLQLEGEQKTLLLFGQGITEIFVDEVKHDG